MGKVAVVTEARKTCCICSSKNLKPKKTIENFPVYMGTTDEAEDQDHFINQVWGVCEECGCIQLLELMPRVWVMTRWLPRWQ